MSRLLVLFGGVAVALCAFLAVSCGKDDRYKALTFFFEGVPSPDGKGEIQVQTVEWTNVDSIVRDSEGKVQTVGSGQRRGSRHKVAAECDKCHAGSMLQRERRLIQKVPELCFSCHEEQQYTEGYVHGPFIAGACVFCHEPHQSGFVHLQREGQPALCYMCHRREDMGTIPDHEDKLETICTECHDPHTSTMKKLLKASVYSAGDPNNVGSSN